MNEDWLAALAAKIRESRTLELRKNHSPLWIRRLNHADREKLARVIEAGLMIEATKPFVKFETE